MKGWAECFMCTNCSISVRFYSRELQRIIPMTSRLWPLGNPNEALVVFLISLWQAWLDGSDLHINKANHACWPHIDASHGAGQVFGHPEQWATARCMVHLLHVDMTPFPALPPITSSPSWPNTQAKINLPSAARSRRDELGLDGMVDLHRQMDKLSDLIIWRSGWREH